MGNPDARVKLVEYLSLACADCVRFTAQGGEGLFQNYVRRGQVSVEYRNVPLNGFDMAGAAISRCGSPRDYFDLTHYLLGNQPRWLARADTLSEAQRNELRGMDRLAAIQRVAELLGLDDIATRQGINRERIRSCLADPAIIDRFTAAQQAASQAGVTGLPGFFVNGQRQEATNWSQLEPQLRAALGH
jgi:protein-disulfide isomerase